LMDHDRPRKGGFECTRELCGLYLPRPAAHNEAPGALAVLGSLA